VNGSKYSRTCIKCKKEFDVKILKDGKPSKRKTCSQECQRKTSGYTASNWTPLEFEFLEQLSQTLPIMCLVKAYNTWASNNNYPRRSVTAIRHKLRKEFGTTKPTLNWFSFSEIASLLGFKVSRIESWKKLSNYPLQSYQRLKCNSVNYVNRKQFKEFAMHHPEKIGGADWYGLLIILEDERMVDEILKTYRTPYISQIKSKKVRCIETNKIYPSLSAASRAFFVTRQSITRAIERGWSANEHHFEYVTW